MFPSCVYAALPLRLAGITLGDSITAYADVIIPETAMGNRDIPCLDEVDLDPSKIKGIRGGSLSYGNTHTPGKLVGIKLKFLDRSEELYEALEREYREAFGDPDGWLGDPFHNVVSWKWVMKEDGEIVEIVLTYSKDTELRPGVSIKMTLRSQWQRELDAYKAKRPKRKKHRLIGGDYSSANLAPFVPQ